MSEYDDVIAVLEEKSTRLKREWNAVRKALATLKGAKVTPAAPPSPRRPPTREPTKYDWTKGKRMWDEGRSIPDITAALGCTDGAVYYRAKHDGWPKRDAKAKREKITQQKCPSCGLKTDVDPCGHCHTAFPLAARSKRK
jgi:hypothetical protein